MELRACFGLVCNKLIYYYYYKTICPTNLIRLVNFEELTSQIWCIEYSWRYIYVRIRTQKNQSRTRRALPKWKDKKWEHTKNYVVRQSLAYVHREETMGFIDLSVNDEMCHSLQIWNAQANLKKANYQIVAMSRECMCVVCNSLIQISYIQENSIKIY